MEIERRINAFGLEGPFRNRGEAQDNWWADLVLILAMLSAVGLGFYACVG